MIMISAICASAGVLLAVSVGVAATVFAQSTPKPAEQPSLFAAVAANQPAVPGAPAKPIYETEIRIWKDGAPITSMLRLKAVPGQAAQLAIPDGNLELRLNLQPDPVAIARVPSQMEVQQLLESVRLAIDSTNLVS